MKPRAATTVGLLCQRETPGHWGQERLRICPSPEQRRGPAALGVLYGALGGEGAQVKTEVIGDVSRAADMSTSSRSCGR